MTKIKEKLPQTVELVVGGSFELASAGLADLLVDGREGQGNECPRIILGQVAARQVLGSSQVLEPATVAPLAGLHEPAHRDDDRAYDLDCEAHTHELEQAHVERGCIAGQEQK